MCSIVALICVGTDGTVLERKDQEFMKTNAIRWCQFGGTEGLFAVKAAFREMDDTEVGFMQKTCPSRSVVAGRACSTRDSTERDGGHH